MLQRIQPSERFAGTLQPVLAPKYESEGQSQRDLHVVHHPLKLPMLKTTRDFQECHAFAHGAGSWVGQQSTDAQERENH
jgi:hypothetical protein